MTSPDGLSHVLRCSITIQSYPSSSENAETIDLGRRREIGGKRKKGEEESARVFDASAKMSYMMLDMEVVHNMGASRHGSFVT